MASQYIDLPVTGGGGGGTVTSVTASSPLSSSGGNTPNISVTDASISNSGVVNTTTQSFAGTKTFTSAPKFSSLTAASIPFLGTGGLVTEDNNNISWSVANTVLNLVTAGDMTGTNTISSYGQLDCYNPNSTNTAGGASTNSGMSASTSRGTGVAATESLSGDYIGGYNFWPYNGTSYVIAADVRSTVQGATATNRGADLQLWTKKNGGALTQALTLSNAQALTLNQYTAGALQTDGSGNVTAGNLSITNFNSGTSASSSTYWRGDGTWSTPAGAGTVTSVALSVPATSILGVTGSPVTTSGTLGLTTTGTSGGIPYFSSTSALSSSALLTANAITLGGGAGAAPASLGSLGTTTTVLHGNAAGAPTFGAVSLTADVTGVTPVANGGTGNSTLTTHGVLVGAATSGITQLAAAAAGTLLTGQGASADPSFSATPVLGINATTAGSLGIANGGGSGATVTIQNLGATSAYNFNLPINQGTAGKCLITQGGGATSSTWSTLGISGGGTNNSSLAVTAGVTYYGSGSAITGLAAGTSGQIFTSSGAGAPTWQNGAIPLIFGTRASPRSVVAATGITSGAGHMSTTAITQNIYAQGSISGTSIAATITAGTIDGQTIRLIAENSTNILTLDNTTTNVTLKSTWTGILNSIIDLMWDTNSWVEVSRNAI